MYEVLEGGVLDLSAESYRSTMKIEDVVITAIDATRYVRGPGEPQ